MLRPRRRSLTRPGVWFRCRLRCRRPQGCKETWLATPCVRPIPRLTGRALRWTLVGRVHCIYLFSRAYHCVALGMFGWRGWSKGWIDPQGRTSGRGLGPAGFVVLLFRGAGMWAGGLSNRGRDRWRQAGLCHPGHHRQESPLRPRGSHGRGSGLRSMCGAAFGRRFFRKHRHLPALHLHAGCGTGPGQCR